MAGKYWLVKTEASAYSIDDLRRDKKTPWTGVRNYQARNFMRDSMHPGDAVLFYHSNDPLSGVVGVAKVASTPTADPTQYKKGGHYYDPKASIDSPRWFLVDFSFVRKFKEPLTLSEIKNDPRLEGMMVAKKGMRLSIQPVSEKHFKYIGSLR